jgi:polygalacturonase
MYTKSAPQGAKGRFAQKSGFFGSRSKILSAIAASLALASVALPAAATNWWSLTPAVSIGSAVLNVRNFGAMGNGTTDDTAAIQAAVNALPASGGTIVVPDGTYMINALKGINLRSHTRLHLFGSAYLKAIPTSASRYWVVKAWNVNNVEIVGGNVVGERTQHQGSTGEWGFGINVSGSNTVYVHDIHVSNCWGDGLLVGGTGSGSTLIRSSNVTLNRVTSFNNRRQGLSITPATQVYVVNSSFSSSNGTAPQSGIDIEPQTQGTTDTIRLENVTLSGNVGNGLEVHDYVSGLVLNKVTSENNQGNGVFTNSPNGVTITNSNLSQNYMFGVTIAGTTRNVQISGNTIQWNGDAWFYRNNVSIFTPGWVPRDVSIASTTSNVTQSNNLISPLRTK